MDTHRLKVFCSVVEQKSFTAAARECFLSQPTVSEHIQKLEEYVSAKLVDRLGREVLPTPVGRILYDYAKRILKVSNEALGSIENYMGRYSGHLAMGASTIPGTYIIPGLLGMFRQSYPDVLVTVKIASSRGVADEVLQGDSEFGVIGAYWKEQAIEWEELFSDQLSLVVHHQEPLAKKGKVSARELSVLPFVDRERNSGTRKVMYDMLITCGVERLNVIAEMGSTEAVRQSVRAGLGAAIISRRAVSEDLAAGRLVELAVDGLKMERPFYLIRRKKRQMSPIAGLFIDFIKENEKSQAAN